LADFFPSEPFHRDSDFCLFLPRPCLSIFFSVFLSFGLWLLTYFPRVILLSRLWLLSECPRVCDAIWTLIIGGFFPSLLAI
jgi:hypothetical protein